MTASVQLPFRQDHPLRSSQELQALQSSGPIHTVLTAVGQGLSNAEICQTLFMAEGTVKTHIGRILHKLDLRDRVHMVMLAYETGLVRVGPGS